MPFAVPGGKFEVREASWQPKRIVLLEFPSMDQARRWYDSGDPWISKNLADGVTITDPDAGTAEVALVPDSGCRPGRHQLLRQ